MGVKLGRGHYFSKDFAVYGLMWENMAEPEMLPMIR